MAKLNYQIIDLTSENENWILECAQILYEEFKDNWGNAWPDLESANVEVLNSLDNERISRVAVLKKYNEIIGWIGGISLYNGHVWEIHPLVVKKKFQQQGIGRALVYDIEKIVQKKGASTLLVGTDDENSMTSIANINLYPNVLSHLMQIRNIQHHPYEFYQKIGFSITGVIPDANGLGKPDIFLSKKVGK